MTSNLPVAYFCAEFGIESKIPTYAGGLGILAGDTLREAAEMNFPMIGIGLMYQGKFFAQKILDNGWQLENPSEFDPDENVFIKPVSNYGKPLLLKENLGGVDVYIKAYQLRVGENVTLYFLSTDSDKNSKDWRSALTADYYGDEETQVRSQMILSIGGIRLLEELNIKPKVYHLNEGRACFINWQIIKTLIDKTKIDFESAFLKAKSQTVYTNHTILMSGNPSYDQSLIQKYAQPFADAMGVPVNEFIKPGIDPATNRFNISLYSLNSSHIASAVSKIHGKILKKDNPKYNWVTITNGVNMSEWQYYEYANPTLTPTELWNIHMERKYKLAEFVLKRTGFGYDANRLVISWARRIADYKEPQAIFKDLDRLTRIIKDSNKPVQLLVAGKAHVGDTAAKNIIQKIIVHMQRELSGNAIFVHNYDIALAKELVSGSDIWLNTPELGKEACGTSGMKAIANGVLNITTLDGWADEVDWTNLGWVIDAKNVAESIYSILEKEVIPLYYNRDKNNIPLEWTEKMRQSIVLSRDFSTRRMLSDYIKKLYT